MSHDVDLRELTIDRGGSDPLRGQTGRRLWTRYAAPAVLIVGFLLLLAWAARDIVFPPKPVQVVPVFATTVEHRPEGATLFKAAGWIEPRPTPIRVAALAPGIVEKLLVVEDQAVQSGEPIAQLIKDDAQLIHEASLADLDLRMAEHEQVEATVAAAETPVSYTHLRAHETRHDIGPCGMAEGLRE